MEFIIILERHFKEDESFVHYCQWQGNEAELEKLFAIIDEKDDTDLYGDVSKFSYSRHRLSESAVDEHCNVKLGIYSYMFNKYTGKFTCPSFTYCTNLMDGDSKTPPYQPKERAKWYARVLDSCFYSLQMGKYFKKDE